MICLERFLSQLILKLNLLLTLILGHYQLTLKRKRNHQLQLILIKSSLRSLLQNHQFMNLMSQKEQNQDVQQFQLKHLSIQKTDQSNFTVQKALFLFKRKQTVIRAKYVLNQLR